VSGLRQSTTIIAFLVAPARSHPWSS